MRHWIPLVIAMLGACGGSAEKGLFGASGGTGGTNSGGASGATSGGSAGVGAQDAATAGGAGTDASTTGGSAGEGGSAGGAGAPQDGGSGGGTGAPGLASCGAEICNLSAGAACCFAQNKGLFCSNDAKGNPCWCGVGCRTLKMLCDGPEDCAGTTKCCAVRDLITPQIDRLECRNECVGVAVPVYEVCHPGAGSCPSGTECKADDRLPAGYYTCQTP
ncbi:MAG: hypothetical protein R3B13_38235 [Polyangiaceae bacterium]